MKAQINTMLEYQNAMNTRVHPKWQEQQFAWYRATWIECAELMDHYGWKRWKKQSPDHEQVKLELIDIWHFGLSDLIERGVSSEDIEHQLQQGLALEAGELKSAVEIFTLNILSSKSFNPLLFGKLMTSIELSFEELFSGYVGKNVLNFFRQDHGYKDGSYHKVWAGREDNEHLVEIIASLDAKDQHYTDTLYKALSQRYEELCENG